eukprot:7021345-Pyramimonas_sp.AAC.1
MARVGIYGPNRLQETMVPGILEWAPLVKRQAVAKRPGLPEDPPRLDAACLMIVLLRYEKTCRGRPSGMPGRWVPAQP